LRDVADDSPFAFRQPNRVEVVPGGLGGIETGLKKLAENKVSGKKLVVRVQETA
jgi:hypothetical protein